ncbi:glycosyltransferase [Chitinispirillales bacterium ANBcel5]|uniref:glycosyltransferase n=1 Tax=Cellulosispirillum alkaliphilum TaxID=3039283 RepID=UPI002A53BABC|nr:glycosyltransferase [Chitinispirillales bacterium ANBcel5]
MKKVVHLVFSLNNGGLENMVVDICNEQSKSAEVTLIVIHSTIDTAVSDLLDSKVKFICLQQKPPTRLPFFVISLWAILWKIKPDILHLHNRMSMKLFPRFLPKSNTKILLTIHNTGGKLGNEIRNVDITYAISNAVKSDIEKRYNINTCINYNGVRVKDIVSKTEWCLRSCEPLKIIQISRLMHKIKGQHVLLKATQLLVQKGVPVIVSFIGNGESLDYLKELAKELNIENSVQFHGSLPKEDVYKTLNHYDVLIQPSLYEGFGLTIAEAMAAKVPVIVPNIEAPLEILKNDKNGYVFRVGDSQHLFEKVLCCIEDYRSGKIESIVHNAYTHVNAMFNIKETSKRYLEA